MHKMKPELETQLIARAQRPGRTEQLEVYQLLHLNEIDDISNIVKKASIEWSKTTNNKNFNEPFGLIHPFILSEKLFKKDIFASNPIRIIQLHYNLSKYHLNRFFYRYFLFFFR